MLIIIRLFFFSATGSIILKMSHGYTVDHQKPDPLVELADNALAEFSLAAEAGKWMVDMMPFCKKKKIGDVLLHIADFREVLIIFLDSEIYSGLVPWNGLQTRR